MSKKEKSLVPSIGLWGMPAMKRLKEEMDLLINQTFVDFLGDDWYKSTIFENMQSSTSFPKVNVSENDSDYIVEIAIAGFDKEDINLELKNNCLYINAGKKEDNKEENKYILREISSRSFNRIIKFPENIKEDVIEATYEKGVIKITLVKNIEKDEEKSIKIKVN
jgi:HSP20 family protein